MIRFGKEKLIAIELTKDEQSHLLQYCEELTLALKNKIRYMTDGTIYLMEGESDVLIGCIGCALQSGAIDNENITAILNSLSKRIPFSNETTEFWERCDAQDSNDLQGWKKAQDKIDEEKKTRPDPNRGNLTPQQITRFTDYYWGDAEFPLQFNKNLSVDDVNQSRFFRNTILFLNKLIEFKDKRTATVRGNLNRKFVKAMYGEMELDEEHRDFTARNKKVLNEDDVFSLHIVRIVCEGAGLIEICSNKILVPTRHYSLLSDENAGELYYLLFDVFFNKFKLSYLDRCHEMDGIQGTIDFSFYSLYRLCEQFQSVEDLFYEAFLPSIINEIEENITSIYSTKELYLTSRIIRPLEGFGLLECKYKQGKFFRSIIQVKKTPLFDKFMSLNL